jgi:hypothetical protein
MIRRRNTLRLTQNHGGATFGCGQEAYGGIE